MINEVLMSMMRDLYNTSDNILNTKTILKKKRKIEGG